MLARLLAFPSSAAVIQKASTWNPEALEPMSGGVFPLRDADLEDPVSSPPGRFRWPGSQRLALAFCGSVD